MYPYPCAAALPRHRRAGDGLSVEKPETDEHITSSLRSKEWRHVCPALLIILNVLVAIGVGAMGIHFFWKLSKTQDEIAREKYEDAIRLSCSTIESRNDPSCRKYR